MTTMLLGQLQQPVLLYFCGQNEDPNVIAANALAISVSNLLIVSSLMGFNNCMDTYMSNAAGQNDIAAVRKYYDRDKIAIFCLWVLLYLLLIATPFIFKFINYEEEFIEYVHYILWIYGIAVLIHGFNDLNYKLFVNLGQANIPAVINVIAIFVHILMCQTIIIFLDLGLRSAPFVQLIIEFIILIVNLVIVTQLKLHPGVLKIDLKFFNYIDYEFIKLGGWSITQVAIEWWAFELVTIMVGSLGITEITIQALNIILIDFNQFIASGIGSATAYFVGGSLSAGYEYNAKKQCVQSIILQIFIAIPFVMSLWYQPQQQIEFMTRDKEVQDKWVEVFQNWLFILLLTDSLQTVLSGTIRGLGLQFRSFWANLVQWIWCVPITQVVVQHWEGDLLMTQSQFIQGSYMHVIGQLWILFRAEWKYFKFNESINSSFNNVIDSNEVRLYDKKSTMEKKEKKEKKEKNKNPDPAKLYLIE